MSATSRVNWISGAFDLSDDRLSLKICSYCGKEKSKFNCSRCKMYYCDKVCQNLAWPHHKIFCGKEISAYLDFFSDVTNLSRSFVLNNLIKDISGAIDKSCRDIISVTVESIIDKIRFGEKYYFQVEESISNDVLGETFHSDESLIGPISKHCFLVPKLNRDHFLLSGCILSECLILMLCINSKTKCIHNDIIAMIAWINSHYHYLAHDPETRYAGISLEPSRTYLKGIYRAVHYDINLPIHIFELARLGNDNNVIYDIRLKPNPYDSTNLPKMHSNIKDAWEDITSAIPTCSNHHLLLIRKQNKSILIQAYSGHYTYPRWCDFSNPLIKMDTPPPTNPEWPRKIEPRPKYRKILDMADLFNLCQDMDKLTLDGDHIQAYSNITGIIHDKSSISRKYQLIYKRMNLDQLVFK